MPDSLAVLQEQKSSVLRRISQLQDFRPGSVTATMGRCGNSRCHCHQPGHPGHGPNFRLTFKQDGKSRTESFPNPAARRAAERQTAEYRKWQQLSREFVAVNKAICRLRLAEEQEQTPQEKKRPKPSSRKLPAK